MRAVVVAVALTLAVVAQGAEHGNLVGHLLVATEHMTDPRFRQAVIYVVRQDGTGAFGLVVNRPVAHVPSAEILKDLGREDRGVRGTMRVHYGGPVAPDQGFVLHSEEWKSDATRVIGAGIAFTASTEVIEAIAHGTGPRRALLALGYAGWAPGQLEAELTADVWTVVDADASLIFDSDASTKWDRAMARRKIML